MHCPSDLWIRLDLRPVFRGRLHPDGQIEDMDHEILVDPESPFGCLLAGHVEEVVSGQPDKLGHVLPLRIRGAVEIDLQLFRLADGSFEIEDMLGNLHDPDLEPIRAILGLPQVRMLQG